MFIFGLIVVGLGSICWDQVAQGQDVQFDAAAGNEALYDNAAGFEDGLRKKQDQDHLNYEGAKNGL